MAKKEELMSIGAAAKAAGVSASSVRNWLKTEKELKPLAVTRAGQTSFRPPAVSELKRIKERRMAKVSPALRKAWASRTQKAKAKKTALPPPATKVAPAPGRAALPAPKAMTGTEAARALGTTRTHLYERLRRLRIKPPGKKGFTPDLMQKLRASFIAPPPPVKKIAPERVRKPQPKPAPGHAAPASLHGAIAQIQATVAKARQEGRAEARGVLLAVLAKVQEAITKLEA